MNYPDWRVSDPATVPFYSRSTPQGSECWRISLSERPNMFRIQRSDASGRVEIDTVVDAENLRAKVKKWRQEGFEPGTEAAAVPGAVAGTGTGARTGIILIGAQIDSQHNGPPGDIPAGHTNPDFMAALRNISLTGSTRPDRSGNIADGEDGIQARTVRIGEADLLAGDISPGDQALIPAVNPAYLFNEQASEVVRDIGENRRVMLIGHTGSGKTSLIEQIAARSGHGVLRANMNGQTTIGDFVGFWTVKGGATLWVDGALPTAMRQGLWLIIDEIDFAEPAILAVLTAVLEPGGRLFLKEKGNEIVSPHPAFRLFSTANAAGQMSRFRHLYQGANLLNEAFLDRWRAYLVAYLSVAEESQVLLQMFAPRLTQDMATTLARIANDCREAFVREDLGNPFSTRRLIDWTDLMLRTGDPERAAGPTIYAKISPEDAAVVRAIIRHHIAFGS